MNEYDGFLDKSLGAYVLDAWKAVGEQKSKEHDHDIRSSSSHGMELPRNSVGQPSFGAYTNFHEILDESIVVARHLISNGIDQLDVHVTSYAASWFSVLLSLGSHSSAPEAF